MTTLENEIDKQSGSLHQVDDLTAMFIVPTLESALTTLSNAADLHMDREMDRDIGAAS